jgi:hypothetical protein
MHRATYGITAHHRFNGPVTPVDTREQQTFTDVTTAHEQIVVVLNIPRAL